MVYEKEGRKEGMGEEWYKRRKEGRKELGESEEEWYKRRKEGMGWGDQSKKRIKEIMGEGGSGEGYNI